MHCFARSGGTLLNRCFVAMPNTIVMSEVNPLGGGGGPNALYNIQLQAKEWYGIDIQSNDFFESVKQMDLFCEKAKKNLIIRDWSFVNFVPCAHNKYNPPCSIQTIKLSTDMGFTSFAFVRNAIDVWLSMKYSPKKFFDPSLLHLYEFIKELKNKKVMMFKYEDFCSNPDIVMKKICAYLHMKYSDNYKNYNNEWRVNGDVVYKNTSRGILAGSILLLSRREITADIANFIKKHTYAKNINDILGYNFDI